MSDIANKVKLFLDAVQEIETFVYCSEISDISLEEIKPILEKTLIVRKLCIDLCKVGLSVALEKKLIQLNIKHVRSMYFVETLPEKVLCKLIHPDVESDVYFFTIQYFIKNLGEDWFEKSCKNMTQMRQGFLAVSSMALVLCGVEEIHASLLLEGWAKTLANFGESKLNLSIEEMLSLEGSNLLISKVCTSSETQGSLSGKKKVIHLLNNKIAQTLIDSFKPDLWQVVVGSRTWFNDLVMANPCLLEKVFEELHLSAEKYSEGVKDWKCPSTCWTLEQAVKVTCNLLRFERTYNRTKNLLEQQSSSNEFWSLLKQGSLKDHVSSLNDSNKKPALP